MEAVKELGVRELEASSLYQRCDLGQFAFDTTDDLEDLTEVIGQARAIEAVQFGMGIEQDGFNIFAMGPTGTGKRQVVREFFERKAAKDPAPSDWCYVHNFEEAHKPAALSFPAGKGVEFRKDMENLVEEMQTALSAAFESEEYQTRRQSLQDEIQNEQQQAFEGLQEKARERGLALLRTPAGLVLAPVRDGEVLSPEELKNLPEEERQQLEQKSEELQEELQKILRHVPRWQREVREKLRQLNREMTNLAIGGLIDELKEKYSDYPEVVDYLNDLQEDVIENAQDLLATEEGQQPQGLPVANQGAEMARTMAWARKELALRRYRVNLLVDHSESKTAPIIYEDNPTYQNLIGRVEHRAQMGALLTDFNLIKPGALHRANGGYLILDVRQLLMQPYAWEGLKRALRAEQIRIESIGQMLSLISTVSLDPEPIPLNVKVALLGDRSLYYLLSYYDPDFDDLFKVSADFSEQMDRSPDNQELYARLIGNLVRKNKLHPFDRSAVARVIEHSARVMGDAQKLSTRTRWVSDLLKEANYWTNHSGNGVVTADDVQRAIDACIYRSDRLRERVQEEIQRGTILIDTEGKKVGQVNGLSVIMLGDFAFGRPSRITARVRLGKGEVVNIEREVELSGPIHSKGVLILSGYLGARYVQDRPLSLSASLVFEQSYSGVEGDSASTAELYTLLSAIAEIPLRQSLAVTGSVNQHGQVQAIGGVNEKIEGFFDICKKRGLTGDQGVLIPASNVKHLMLRQDVIDAVDAGKFHIYPVETIDQGIEILTGMPAGERDESGNYPEGTFNLKVEARLVEMAARRIELMKEGE